MKGPLYSKGGSRDSGWGIVSNNPSAVTTGCMDGKAISTANRRIVLLCIIHRQMLYTTVSD